MPKGPQVHSLEATANRLFRFIPGTAAGRSIPFGPAFLFFFFFLFLLYHFSHRVSRRFVPPPALRNSEPSDFHENSLPARETEIPRPGVRCAWEVPCLPVFPCHSSRAQGDPSTVRNNLYSPLEPRLKILRMKIQGAGRAP